MCWLSANLTIKKLLQLQKVEPLGVSSQEVSWFWQASLFAKMPSNTALISSVCVHTAILNQSSSVIPILQQTSPCSNSPISAAYSEGLTFDPL